MFEKLFFKASRWNNYGMIVSPGPVYCPKIMQKKIHGYYMSSKPIDFGKKN